METQSKETTTEEFFKLSIVGYKTAADERDRLRQQNMWLVEALEACEATLCAHFAAPNNPEGRKAMIAMNHARAALALAEGKL